MNASNAYRAPDLIEPPKVPVPKPTPLGALFLLASIAALLFGALRSELSAVLWGSIFLAVEIYSFTAITLTLALRRRDILGYACRMTPRECIQGEKIVATARGRRRFRPPLILVRYEAVLRTTDGRQTVVAFDPEGAGAAEFSAGARGAYGARHDALWVADALGFFVSAYSILAEEGPRLVVRPAPARETIEGPILYGGSEFRIDSSFRRTEDLTDNRKYAPGDDPRRINWKLFGHSGELFVRDGEPEPPPRSRFVVLVDASVDPTLYDPEAGRRAVDILSEQGLGLVNSVIAGGLEPRFGFNGGALPSGDAKAAAAAFAIPAAADLRSAADLPLLGAEDDTAVVLALPRTMANSSALDRFIRDAHPRRKIFLFFFVSGPQPAEEISLVRRIIFRPSGESSAHRRGHPAIDPNALASAADDCVATYRSRGGLYVSRAKA